MPPKLGGPWELSVVWRFGGVILWSVSYFIKHTPTDWRLT